MRIARAVAFAALVASTAALAEGDEILTKLVIVSRHGVRTPLPPPAELATWASQPWPVWNQPPGALTPRGAQLASVMGRYYRQFASEAGAMTAAGCPAVGSTNIYAHNLPRTQATARALADGFAPNCNVGYRARDGNAPDPLFHPLETGACRLDALTAQTRVLERAGGDLNRLVADMKGPVYALKSILQCCAPALCTGYGRGDKCTLGELPTALSPRPDGAGLGMIGALAIASTTAEIMLL
jgi:4-phytase/acid phosphatase